MVILNLDKFKKKSDDKPKEVPDELPSLSKDNSSKPVKSEVKPEEVKSDVPDELPGIENKKEEPAPEAAAEVKEESAPEVAAEVKEEPAPEPAAEVKEESAPEAAAEVKKEPASEPVVEVKEEPAPAVVAEVKEEPAPEPVVEVKEEPAPEPVVEVKEEPKLKNSELGDFFSSLIEKYDSSKEDVEDIFSNDKKILDHLKKGFKKDVNKVRINAIEEKIISLMKNLSPLEKKWKVLNYEIEQKKDLSKRYEKQILEVSLDIKKLIIEKSKLINSQSKKRTVKKKKNISKNKKVISKSTLKNKK